MFRNVLVGVNGEEGGRDAIALARMLVTPDGELTVAHVFGSEPHELRGWSGPPMSDSREHAREVLERACTEADLEAHIRWHAASSVGRGLHELAEITEADLLVVGSSRRGLLGRVRLGDHTRAALNGAPCAVAVAPAGYSSEPSPLMRRGRGGLRRVTRERARPGRCQDPRGRVREQAFSLRGGVDPSVRLSRRRRRIDRRHRHSDACPDRNAWWR